MRRSFFAIENRASTKWWWLVHTALPKRGSFVGNLGGFSSWEARKSRQMEKPRWPVGAFLLSLVIGLLLAPGEARLVPAAEFRHWRLAPFPCTDRGWKLRSSSQRTIWCLEMRTFASILK